MKRDIIYNKWTEFITNYKEYFESYEERWIKYLEKVKNYIDSHKKRPSQHDIIKDVGFLGRWIITQKSNYNKKKEIMKNKEIYDKWTEFIQKYKEYFLSNEELWSNKLNEVIEYIKTNKKLPSSRHIEKEIKILGEWLYTQKKSVKNKTYIMENKEIYDKWTNFINDPNYKVYFE